MNFPTTSQALVRFQGCVFKNFSYVVQGDVELFKSLPDALYGVDFVFEAVVDSLDVKQSLFESKFTSFYHPNVMFYKYP